MGNNQSVRDGHMNKARKEMVYLFLIIFIMLAIAIAIYGPNSLTAPIVSNQPLTFATDSEDPPCGYISIDENGDMLCHQEDPFPTTNYLTPSTIAENYVNITGDTMTGPLT